MKGWVYIISNKAQPNMIKVGYTMKDPDLRAAELNHTGSPHSYVVDYEVLVENPRDVEQTAHRRLRDHPEGKEWFRCSAEEAIAAIKAAVGTGAQVENYKRADREHAEAIYLQKTAEERKRLAAEEARMKQEAILEDKRHKIMLRHEAELNAALPDDFRLHYVFVGTTILLAIVFLFPKMGDAGVISLLIIGTLIITPFVKGHFIERAKESDKYRAILARRDAELAAIENGRDENVTSPRKGTAVESTSRRNTSAMADQMDAHAQYDLGVTYAYGQGVTQDYQEAAKWFRLSADQGIPEAQCDLGAMLQAGFGVPQDYTQAMMWYLIAKANGSTLPDQNLHQLESLSTPAQIAEAQRRAREWLAARHSEN
jgi:hypothetical protein